MLNVIEQDFLLTLDKTIAAIHEYSHTLTGNLNRQILLYTFGTNLHF